MVLGNPFADDNLIAFAFWLAGLLTCNDIMKEFRLVTVRPVVVLHNMFAIAELVLPPTSASPEIISVKS